MATIKRMAARPHQVLDPRTMGRPVHLLGRFTAQIREDLSELFHQRLNRRYRARFEIGEVSIDATAPPGPKRWLTFGSSSGRINCALDRQILLCVLGYRYGTHANAARTTDAPDTDALDVSGATDCEQTDEPRTATEERLATRLGLQLVNVIAQRIDALSSGTEANAAPTEFTEVAGTSLHGAWTLQAKIVEHTHKVAGSVWLRLEEGWITRLLRGLAPTRERSKVPKSSVAATQSLPARLQLTLTARLLEKQMLLGTLLDLRVGDIVPITLDTTDVLIGDSRLFTASVAEHKGKLCLTCFEDME